MKHTLLLILGALTISSTISVAQNLIINPGFEIDNVAPDHQPDFFHPRSATFLNHSVVDYTGTNVATHGNKIAQFQNTNSSPLAGYFYSNYNAEGTIWNPPSANSGAIYEATVQCRVNTGFEGKGIMLQIFLHDEDSTILGNNQSVRTTSEDWVTLKVTARITGRISRISAGVSFDGIGVAWVDNMKLRKIGPSLAKNPEFEKVSSAPFDQPDFFAPRLPASQSAEQRSDFAYLGRKSAKFNLIDQEKGYFYGPYNSGGTVLTPIPVSPGDSFKASAFGRTAPSFSGSGLKVSLIFWSDNTFVSRVDSPYSQTGSLWKKFECVGTVPQSANAMSYSVEAFGTGEAWMDQLQVIPENLIVNSSMETNTVFPATLPDFWLPRGGRVSSYHQSDSTPGNSVNGQTSVLINNTSTAEETGYFYGPANATSNSLNLDALRVNVGETYQMSAYGRVAEDFEGSGIRVSLVFWEDAPNAPGAYVGRSDSEWHKPIAFEKLSVEGVVPANADRMTYSVEYKGRNKAWFDTAELYKIKEPWHLAPAPTDVWEALGFTAPADKLQKEDAVKRFKDEHQAFELAHNDGSWGTGYGAQSNNHPLIRSSANAAMGYLSAIESGVFNASDVNTFEERALQGLDWLLGEQLPNGAFAWWWTETPITQGDTIMYESGLAGMALIRGYAYLTKTTTHLEKANNYREAANGVCDYLCTIDASPNANFNAFAIFALTENYKQTGKEQYLEKALEFIDIMLTFQLQSGMWSDYHNQLIQYHAIIAESLGRALAALPASHPKASVISHALHKAVNHIRLSQNPDGSVLVHPTKLSEWRYCPHSISSICIAYILYTCDSIDDSMKTLSKGLKFINPDVKQGHTIRALGEILDAYY